MADTHKIKTHLRMHRRGTDRSTGREQGQPCAAWSHQAMGFTARQPCQGCGRATLTLQIWPLQPESRAPPCQALCTRNRRVPVEALTIPVRDQWRAPGMAQGHPAAGPAPAALLEAEWQWRNTPLAARAQGMHPCPEDASQVSSWSTGTSVEARASPWLGRRENPVGGSSSQGSLPSLAILQLVPSTGQVVLVVLLALSHAAEEVVLIRDGLQEVGLHQAHTIQL